jgi:hypothetical protein
MMKKEIVDVNDLTEASTEGEPKLTEASTADESKPTKTLKEVVIQTGSARNEGRPKRNYGRPDKMDTAPLLAPYASVKAS